MPVPICLCVKDDDYVLLFDQLTHKYLIIFSTFEPPLCCRLLFLLEPHTWILSHQHLPLVTHTIDGCHKIHLIAKEVPQFLFKFDTSQKHFTTFNIIIIVIIELTCQMVVVYGSGSVATNSTFTFYRLHCFVRALLLVTLFATPKQNSIMKHAFGI